MPFIYQALTRIIQIWSFTMKKVTVSLLTTVLISFSACQPATKDPLKVEVLALETEQQKQAYAMGASIGQIVEDKLNAQKEMNIEYDQELVVKGFIAAMQGQSQVTKEEIKTINREIDTRLRKEQKARKAKKSEKNKAAGKAFLAENAQRKGIVVTESGLQYEVLRQGEGNRPVATDTVKVQYRGTLLNGTEFDSSYARNKPLTFPLTRVIKGWTEGVQLMKEGAKFKFYVPSNLAYGARSTGKISSHSTLIFEVELLEIIEKN